MSAAGAQQWACPSEMPVDRGFPAGGVDESGHSVGRIRPPVGGRHIPPPPSVIPTKEDVMKFVLLIYQGTTPLPGTERWKALPEAEQRKIYADYAELNQAPGMTPGLPLGLPDAARTVQVRDGKPQVKNGTHLPEGIGGFSILEADSMEAAIALAARIPAARLGGAVEIRPAEKYW
jgi:hypothetical protein